MLILEVWEPSGSQLLAGGFFWAFRSCLTLYFAPVGRLACVTHATMIGYCVSPELERFCTRCNIEIQFLLLQERFSGTVFKVFLQQSKYVCPDFFSQVHKFTLHIL